MGEASKPHSGRCPSCGLSPYESGIGDSDISRIVAERNSLLEQLRKSEAVAQAALDTERDALQRVDGLLEQLEASQKALKWIAVESGAMRPVHEKHNNMWWRDRLDAIKDVAQHALGSNPASRPS